MPSTSTLLLGVTATPERSDDYGLEGIFDEITSEKPMLDLIGEGYLCDIRAMQIAIQGADLAGLSVRQGDIVAIQAGEVLMAAKAPDHVADAIVAHAKLRKTIVFTPTVAVAFAIAEALQARGIAAAGLDGATPTDERRRILHDFRVGAVQVVVNCAVLTEGFDEPR